MRNNSVEQTTFSGLVVMVNDLLSAEAELFSATPLTPGQIQSALHQIYDLVQGHRTAANAKEGEGQMLAIPSGLYTGRSTSKLLKLGENAKDEYKFLVNNLPKLFKGPTIFVSLLPMIVTPLVGSLIMFWMVDNRGVLGNFLSWLVDDPDLSVKASTVTLLSKAIRPNAVG